MEENDIMLIPENGGTQCPYNGKHTDQAGNSIECCCDECDYLIICTDGECLYEY